jgi:hypothetical protein
MVHFIAHGRNMLILKLKKWFLVILKLSITCKGLSKLWIMLFWTRTDVFKFTTVNNIHICLPNLT